jgi:uncharacterized membrane protein
MLYVAGLVVFMGIHLVPPLGLRPAWVSRFGENGYRGIFSLISLLGLGLVIYGWNDFPNSYFYEPPKAMKHINLTLMMASVFFLTVAYVPNNIRRRVKNPMLTGVKIWAFGHILANGDLRSLLLFVTFLAYSVFDVIAVKRRGTWQPKPAVAGYWNVITVVVAFSVYVLLLFNHGRLFGVPALGSLPQ